VATVATLKIIKKGKRTDNRLALFCIVHNEECILPHFFRHYDQLGISDYIFFDDRSSDRTREILDSREDVTVYQADVSYGDVVTRKPNGEAVRFGSALKSNFFRLMGKDLQWAIIVDADEFLYLPGTFTTLLAITQYLEERHQPYLTASLVDFYPARLEQCLSSTGGDPLSFSPYFDRGPLFEWTGGRYPKQFNRGVRARLQRMLYERYPETARHAFGRHGPYLASTWKVPLLKNAQDLVLIDDHEINVAPKHKTSGCLAHFKFAPNILGKIDFALKRGSYYHHSIEYRFLRAVFDNLAAEDLICEETVQFASKSDLKDAKHMALSVI
jgi:hypothetical protein